jgi:hypothetical protein
MSSMASLLARLKQESKKTVAKAAKNSGISYGTDSMELFGEIVEVKRVMVANQVDYTVGWVMDNQTNSCMRCNSQFSMMTWRHHCRSCGFVICKSCGDKKLNFTAFEEESPAGSRVCRPCYNTPIAKTVRKGPPTLVSRTPIQESVNDSINISRCDQPTDTSCNTSSEACSSKPDCFPAQPQAEKLHAPKLRPTVRCDVIVPETILLPAPQTAITYNTTDACESLDKPMPLPVFEDYEVGSSLDLDSSMISTGTKTARNTAINAVNVAPPPKRGQTCTAPEIFSPAPSAPRSLDYLDLETPLSGGSIGYGETITDFTKFGSPLTRKLIMDDARTNGMWVAEEDDLSSTNGSSVAPTPTSVISGTTNGGAGVGYIHSPWNQTFSPFGSQQKPVRLLPHTGQSSVGRSGRRRSSSASRVRFADASFSTEAGADILGTAVESSPSLPLTREQLQAQQERYRVQAFAQGRPAARVDLRGAMQDTENVARSANKMPTVAAPQLKGGADKSAAPVAQHKPATAAVGQNQPAMQQTAGMPVPSLNKPRAGRAAPR